MQKLKGISPLVAAVLLIAITMTIAGGVAYWVTQFVQKSGDTFQSNATSFTDCGLANVAVRSCVYDVNNTRMTIIVDNIGRIDLSGLAAQVIYSNGSISSYTLNGSIPTNRLQSYILSSVSSDYTSVAIKTSCPAVSAETSCR
jgi:flagellin-like protein